MQSRRAAAVPTAAVQVRSELAARVAWLGIGIMVVWLVVEAFYGTTTDLVVEGVLTLLLLSVPLLRRVGRHTACRITALAAADVVVLAGALLYEPGNGGLLPIVPIAGLPLLLFDRDEGRWRWLGVLVPVAAAIVLDAYGPGPILGIPRVVAPWWHRPANLGAALTLSAMQFAWVVRTAAVPAVASWSRPHREVDTAVVSHELRTPATALHLQVTLLQRFLASRTDVDERAAALLRATASTSRQLTALVDTLYDLSRLRSGQLVLDLLRTDLADVARRVVETLDVGRFDGVGRVRLHAPAPVHGEWDPVRLEQALTNLVSNALKYGGEAPVDVVVGVTADGRTAHVEVRDRGIGIPSEIQDRVFLPFQRAAAAKASFEGLGLGLYVVREIVEAHGGTVRVASAEGEGSRFDVELPLAQ